MGLDMGSLLNLFSCAYKSGQYDFIVLFSTHYFNQFEESTFNGELLVVVCWMVRALVELKDGQSINGLKLWLEQMFGACLAWLDFAAMLADGELENSLVGLDALSVEYLSNRDIVTETIFMLRERALRQILDPSLCHQLAPSFYSQFMRPIGAPPMFSTDLLNASVVLELSSWNQFDRLRTPVAPPNFEATNSYNLFNSIDQIESNLSSMQKIFANFGAQSVPDVLNCLHESEKQVLNLSREFADFGMSSLTGARLFPIHVFVQLFRDIVFSTNAVESIHLNELLLHNKKWPDFTRLEIGQKIANWIEKFFGTTNPRFTELNPAFIKLSRRTGNLRLASSYLNKAPRGVLNQNILKNNFGELINLSEGLKLEILRNDPSNSVGLQQKFFAFADLTASHTDIFLASNSNKEQQASEPIVKACLQLGNLVNFVPIKRELLTSKNPKSAFWTQVTSNLNTYQTSCLGDRFESLLSGALLSMPRFLSTQLPKAHKHLSEWSMSQASTDVSFGVDAIRLMPGEEVALQALCGNLNEKTRESFLKLIGQNDNLDEFQSRIQNTPEFMNDATLLNGIESKSFEELWNALKARQQMFYGIAS
ncbi:hypothetical protein M3Y97_00406300 [Aphelenchoides bicaudatus]|nr:hypothetical protein M3Y97_00406300 [Aphelenchoides bicaudatus]